jgi:hypothetical protein
MPHIPLPEGLSGISSGLAFRPEMAKPTRGTLRMNTFAGVWERWRDPATKEALETFAVITTDANELLQSMHDRMPVSPILLLFASLRMTSQNASIGGSSRTVYSCGSEDDLACVCIPVSPGSQEFSIQLKE